MLIKVFGEWINPALLMGITGDDSGTRLHFGVGCFTDIPSKNPDEVAAEIKRLVDL
jgi:hypothetical protein